jgi:fluoride exporter
MIRGIILVFLGGGLGSTIRFMLGKWINSFYQSTFPLATLVINVAACFLLGLAIGLADHKQLISASSRLFWAVGFCGGFSTFSTFSNESLVLLQAGLTLSMAAYIALSVALSITASFLGLMVVQGL